MKKFNVIYFDVATMKTVDAKIFTAFTRKGRAQESLGLYESQYRRLGIVLV